jgi:hypothetical protein
MVSTVLGEGYVVGYHMKLCQGRLLERNINGRGCREEVSFLPSVLVGRLAYPLLDI